jgi:hypothetical protein
MIQFILCLFRMHDWECLTPDHGFIVQNIISEDERPEFLHASRCRCCDKVKSFVSLYYFTIHEPEWFRDSTVEEEQLFLTALRRKTQITGRIPVLE